MLDDLLILFGRFHPLIIHLPIGFIVLGILIELNKKKLKWSNDILKFIFFWATITGIFSILSGFLQYQKEGYLWENIQNHFYAGILTVILSFSFYLKLIQKPLFKLIPRNLFTIGNSIIIIITGHLGGNITHGKEHLVEPLKNLASLNNEKNEIIKYYDDYKEKSLFSNMIQPIIDDKCVKCHNLNKSKGGLQMHNIAALKKGGRNGTVINLDSPEMSEIYVRIHLPREEKKHMPPNGGKQLTKEEIVILSKWIKNGSSFNQSIDQFKLDPNIINYFFSVEKPFFPSKNISSPNIEVLKSIKKKKILLNPVNKNSNFLVVSTLNNSEFGDPDLSLFVKINENIVSLDLSNSRITDSIFSNLKNYSNLTVLKLNDTEITGKNIHLLSQLKNLKRLYLVNTKFEQDYLNELIKFNSLEKVYLYQENGSLKPPSKIISKEYLKIFDFGNYTLDKNQNNFKS